MPIRDTRMMANALEQRWPISEQMRAAIVARLVRIVADPTSKPREVVAASRGLLSAESQNQLDELKTIDGLVSSNRMTTIDGMAEGRVVIMLPDNTRDGNKNDDGATNDGTKKKRKYTPRKPKPKPGKNKPG